MSDELAELKTRYDRLNLLYQVSNVIHSTLDSEKALQWILREAVRLMRATSGSVALINPTSQCLDILAHIGLPDETTDLRLRVGEGITGWVAQTGKTACVGNVTKDPRYIMLRPEIRSELAVPLEVDGELRGVLNVDAQVENAFTKEDQELLQDLAVQAAKVIRTTWLYEQLRLKARLFESLVSVGQTINSTLSLDDALKVITREACVLMDGKMCSLVMVDRDGEWLNLRASYGAGPDYLARSRSSMAESLMGIVVRRKKPLQVENIQSSNRHENVQVARREGLVSLLSVPLLFGGQAIGTLNVYKGRAHSYSNEEIRILSALAELSALAIEKARLYERIVDVEEQLRQNEKLSALGLLAAEVAHEIRNPLTVMKMMFHSLDLNFAPKDPRGRDAQVLRDKMDHLNKIVEKILDFARHTEPKLMAVDVNQLIDDMGLLVRHKLRNHNIRFERKLAEKLPLLSADASQLEQVFLNLTLNAVEAMADGGTLTISSKRSATTRGSGLSGQIIIEFKDTGAGMSDEQQSRAFTSLLNTTKEKGSGLGLAVVSKIVEAHQGKISVKSKLGHGTVIRLSFPVPQPAD